MNVLPWIMLVSLSANPCTNGSFEELDAGGFPADWGPVGQQASISSDAHAGKWALRLVRQRGTEGETGLNRVRLIHRLRGGIDFWYKAVSASDANLRVYVIPIDAAGVERTASSRATFTVPAGHIGDGQWRHARLAYDFTKNPAVKMVHFAARIEGAAGQLLLDDFSYVEHVGPVLRFGTVRLEEDPQQPGRRCRVHVPIYNDGDAAAQDVPFTLQLPTGLTASPAEVRLRDLPRQRRAAPAVDRGRKPDYTRPDHHRGTGGNRAFHNGPQAGAATGDRITALGSGCPHRGTAADDGMYAAQPWKRHRGSSKSDILLFSQSLCS